MIFKRKRKKVMLDEQQAAEFYRALAAYNEALARLPPNWRDIAEGKADSRRRGTRQGRSLAMPSRARRRRCSESGQAGRPKI